MSGRNMETEGKLTFGKLRSSSSIQIREALACLLHGNGIFNIFFIGIVDMTLEFQNGTPVLTYKKLEIRTAIKFTKKLFTFQK